MAKAPQTKMVNTQDNMKDAIDWRFGLLRLFAVLPICNGLVGFALAYTILPQIMPFLLQSSALNWLSVFPMPVGTIILCALSLITGLVLYMIHAKCCMAYPLKKYKFPKITFSKCILYVVSLLISAALYVEYLEHLQLFLTTTPLASVVGLPALVIGLKVIAGVAAACFCLAAIDRADKFTEQHADALRFSWLKMFGAILLLAALSNQILHYTTHAWLVGGCHLILGGILVGLIAYTFKIEWASEAKSSFIGRWGDRFTSILLLLLHASAEAGLAAHGAKLFGLTHASTVSIAIPLAVCFFVINLCLETMIDGTEVLDTEDQASHAGHDHGLKLVSSMLGYMHRLINLPNFIYDFCFRAQPPAPQQPVAASNLAGIRRILKQLDADEYYVVDQVDLFTLDYDMPEVVYKFTQHNAGEIKQFIYDDEKHKWKLYAYEEENNLYRFCDKENHSYRVTVLGLIAAGCIGLIGGIELHLTLSMGLGVAMVLMAATALVERKFMSANIHRFEVKYFDLFCHYTAYKQKTEEYKGRTPERKEHFKALANRQILTAERTTQRFVYERFTRKTAAATTIQAQDAARTLRCVVIAPAPAPAPAPSSAPSSASAPGTFATHGCLTTDCDC